MKKTNFNVILSGALIIAASFMLLSGQLFAQVTKEVKFTTTGSEQTWTIPAGVSEVTIECWGGGGAGGFMGSSVRAASGGGGGAYAKTTLAVEQCTDLTIKVGAGGSGQKSTNGIGEDSYVKYNSTTVVLAVGGGDVGDNVYETAGQGGQASSCIGDIVFSGGNGGTGSSGAYCGSGGGGAAGGRGGNGGNGGNGAQRTGNLISGYTYHPGTPGEIATGSTYSGNGGAGVYTMLISTDGNTGDTYGGGGSGGVSSLTFNSLINPADGGDGAQGLVVVTYTVPDPMSVDNMTVEVCSGHPFSITPTGSNIYPNTTYSWPTPTGGAVLGTAAGTNQTTVNGTLTCTTTDDAVVTYNVTAQSCDSTANFTVTVTVKGFLTPGTIGTDILSCHEGDTLKKFINIGEGMNPGYQYLWAMSTDNVNWSIIEGANEKNYTPTYAGHPGVTYYKRGYYSVCDTVYSNTVTLTYPGNVYPGDVVSSQAKKYCVGSDITATLEADGISIQSGTSYTRQWQKSTDGGTTWSNISGETGTTYDVAITNFTTPVSYRYTITLDGCTDSIVSNNQWDYSLYVHPIINKLIAADTCPGLAEYYITADITPGDGAIALYQWDGGAAKPYDTDTIHKGYAPACNTVYKYNLRVIDIYGCKSELVVDSFKTPSLTLSDIPEQPAKLVPSDCKYVIPNMRDTINAHFNVACGDNLIQSYTCTPAEGSDINPTETKSVTIDVTDTCGNVWTKTFDVKAPVLPILNASDVTFDDSNDTIYLYYGVCDTLLNIEFPNYTTTSEYSEVLTKSNNRSASNSGAILGRLQGGTDTTITWALSDPCLDTLFYTKHYVVLYPKCGEGVTVTDVDGNVYQTVRVGCECWTKPNLKTTTVSDTSYAYQNDTNNVTKFGRLYSWYSAVNLPKDSTNPVITIDPNSYLSYVQGICPTGWALPTTESFATLMGVAGDAIQLKSSDATTWLPGMNGNNATGFEAVGSGYYSEIQPHFYDLYGEVYFWTSEGDPITKKGVCSSITLTCPTMLVGSLNMNMGLSVRCVKRSND